jgi:hypothetical protein
MSTAATAAAAPAPMPPAALTRPGTTPPMATLWAVANRLPATTLPIPACIPAAIVPNSSERLDGYLGLAWGGNLPAMGPAAPKPTAPSRTGATKGVRTTPVAVPMVARAIPVKTGLR